VDKPVDNFPVKMWINLWTSICQPRLFLFFYVSNSYGGGKEMRGLRKESGILRKEMRMRGCGKSYPQATLEPVDNFVLTN
jgi:hypothetical protein